MQHSTHATLTVPGAEPNDTSGLISTASVAELAVSSPDAVLQDAQARLRRANLFGWYLGGAVLVANWASTQFGGAAAGAAILLLLGAALPVRAWSNARRTARLIYDVDNDEVVERIAMANAVGQWLGKPARLWHVFYAAQTTDWKRNAGASSLIRRTTIRATSGSLPQIELNIEPWCVPVGPQRILFLPDRLMIWDGRHLAGLPYETLRAHASVTRFIEEDGVPSDSRQVGSTWRYVKKDGGPDLRFTNNAQLPVLEYGELEVLSESGLRIVLKTSNPVAAKEAANALMELAKRASGRTAAVAPQTYLKPTPVVQPLPTTLKPAPVVQPLPVPPEPIHQPIKPQEDETAVLVGSVATLLRYIAAADRRLADGEVVFAQNIIRQLLPAEHPHVSAITSSFRSLPTDRASVDAALVSVSRTNEAYRRRVLDTLQQLSRADGKATPKELERLAEVRQVLVGE
ncbi:TerB family tellurite resistance protein [Archangium sp.]|jgi:hypothetical protein|uniref:tellurite resistance TerB family protein n=1 Tax=Archangium sp. TaxID=1872627 RepID=UPI002ED9C95A